MSMGISSFVEIVLSRIQRQQQIKQWQKEQPIVEMSKEQVEEMKLVDYVLQDDDDGEMMTFATW